MNKQILIWALATTMLAVSCSKDDNIIKNGNDPLALKCEINDKTVLTNRNSSGVDYIVDCGVVVRGELIIEPGTTIQFKDGAYLDNTTHQFKLQALFENSFYYVLCFNTQLNMNLLQLFCSGLCRRSHQ